MQVNSVGSGAQPNEPENGSDLFRFNLTRARHEIAASNDHKPVESRYADYVLDEGSENSEVDSDFSESSSGGVEFKKTGEGEDNAAEEVKSEEDVGSEEVKAEENEQAAAESVDTTIQSVSGGSGSSSRADQHRASADKWDNMADELYAEADELDARADELSGPEAQRLRDEAQTLRNRAVSYEQNANVDRETANNIEASEGLNGSGSVPEVVIDPGEEVDPEVDPDVDPNIAQYAALTGAWANDDRIEFLDATITAPGGQFEDLVVDSARGLNTAEFAAFDVVLKSVGVPDESLELIETGFFDAFPVELVFVDGLIEDHNAEAATLGGAFTGDTTTFLLDSSLKDPDFNVLSKDDDPQLSSRGAEALVFSMVAFAEGIGAPPSNFYEGIAAKVLAGNSLLEAVEGSAEMDFEDE